MKVFVCLMGLEFASSASAECLLKASNGWIHDRDQMTDETCSSLSARFANYEYVDIVQGPGFATLTFYKGGAVTGNSVLAGTIGG